MRIPEPCSRRGLLLSVEERAGHPARAAGAGRCRRVHFAPEPRRWARAFSSSALAENFDSGRHCRHACGLPCGAAFARKRGFDRGRFRPIERCRSLWARRGGAAAALGSCAGGDFPPTARRWFRGRGFRRLIGSQQGPREKLFAARPARGTPGAAVSTPDCRSCTIARPWKSKARSRRSRPARPSGARNASTAAAAPCPRRAATPPGYCRRRAAKGAALGVAIDVRKLLVAPLDHDSFPRLARSFASIAQAALHGLGRRRPVAAAISSIDMSLSCCSRKASRCASGSSPSAASRRFTARFRSRRRSGAISAAGRSSRTDSLSSWLRNEARRSRGRNPSAIVGDGVYPGGICPA